MTYPRQVGILCDPLLPHYLLPPYVLPSAPYLPTPPAGILGVLMPIPSMQAGFWNGEICCWRWWPWLILVEPHYPRHSHAPPTSPPTPGKQQNSPACSYSPYPTPITHAPFCSFWAWEAGSYCFFGMAWRVLRGGYGGGTNSETLPTYPQFSLPILPKLWANRHAKHCFWALLQA